MSQLRLLKPNLYTSPDEKGDIQLMGGRCSCGYCFFPMQHYGCEQCGAKGDELKAVPLTGKGELVSSAVVHKHADERRQTPFVVGSVRLTDGPVVRTLLDVDTDVRLAPGTELTAVLVDVEGKESETFQDLRFRPSRLVTGGGA
ncbi:hypothetical protein NBRC116494_33440 [Aurantivibrio plasticivorans]